MKIQHQAIVLFVVVVSLILLSSFVLIVVNSDSSVIKKEIVYRSSEVLSAVKEPESKSLPLILFIASEIIGFLPSKANGVLHYVLLAFKLSGKFLFKRVFRSQ